MNIFERFLIVTLFILLISFFASPFVVMYLIYRGFPEEIVDCIYWGSVGGVWALSSLVLLIDWKLRKK